MSEGAIIEAKQVYKSVKTLENHLVILEDINLSIQAATVNAIVGVSGSGKSTLLSLLAGLDVPTQGDIWLQGENLVRLNEEDRTKIRSTQVGFIFQAFHLLPNLTALENVMLPLELIGKDESEETAKEMLRMVHLSHRFHHYPNQLSGGEQQRVAIARAFIIKPKILFADEPTGNLDAKTGKKVCELLFELNQEYQTTLVFVTHDHLLAEKCQQVLEIEAGKLVS